MPLPVAQIHLPSDCVMMREQHAPLDSPSSVSIPNLIALHHRDSSSRIQFPVLILSLGKLMALSGYPEDKVQSIHEKIHSVTGIALAMQRLMHGKQELLSHQTLSGCMITNSSRLCLLAQRNKSLPPIASQVADDLVWMICRLCRWEEGVTTDLVKSKVMELAGMIPIGDAGLMVSYLNALASSFVPEAMVMLYRSPGDTRRDCAGHSIRGFVAYITRVLPQPTSLQCVPVVLRFCELFRQVGAHDDSVYKFCRSSLGVMLNHAKKVHESGLRVIVPYVSELASKVSQGLVSSMECISNSGPSQGEIQDFVAFLRPLKGAIKDDEPLPMPAQTSCILSHQSNITKFLYGIFNDLFTKLLMCLDAMEDLMRENKVSDGWNQYLVILNELCGISKLYNGVEEYFWMKLRHHKVSLCHLILRYAKRGEDYGWILEHKELTNFEARRHLVMLLLPEVMSNYDDQYEIAIDRSMLLDDSYEFVTEAEPEWLRAGLYMDFLDEEAIGPGVLREWFFLMCQELFNPRNDLFVACPNDLRRVFPNPALEPNPLHLEYFKFAGRVIALALTHEIQVGIVFDRSFLLQLAGIRLSLEDIKDADPYLHSSCHQILDMDPLAVDQDVLGLTFAWEFGESGSIRVAEFFPGGENVSVNSTNRKEYVHLLIQHRFVIPVVDQMMYFAEGFTDIVREERIYEMCFKSLELEDLDRMLHGSESDIPVEDWKAHTEYVDYVETDPQICWFWQIVGGMTAEQRQVLLFFWISVKYLPMEGFCGLPSRIFIYKSNEPIDHLPSSHTCAYQLCLPAYPSMSVMQDRLHIITQDHIGCSFGMI